MQLESGMKQRFPPHALPSLVTSFDTSSWSRGRVCASATLPTMSSLLESVWPLRWELSWPRLALGRDRVLWRLSSFKCILIPAWEHDAARALLQSIAWASMRTNGRMWWAKQLDLASSCAARRPIRPRCLRFPSELLCHASPPLRGRSCRHPPERPQAAQRQCPADHHSGPVAEHLDQIDDLLFCCRVPHVRRDLRTES